MANNNFIKSYRINVTYFDLIDYLKNDRAAYIFEYMANDFNLLGRMTNGIEKEVYFTSITKLSKLFYINRRTVKSILELLTEKGLITIVEQKIRVGYFIRFTDLALQIKDEESVVYNEHRANKSKHFSTRKRVANAAEKAVTTPSKNNVEIVSKKETIEERNDNFDRTKSDEEFCNKILN